MFLSKMNFNTPHARFYCQQAAQKISKIGFIGLGNMGYRMCKNLIKKNYELTVFDLNNEIVDKIKKEGAHAANSTQSLVKNVDCVITMVPAGPDLLAVYTPDVLKALKPQSLVIDSSTVEHSVSQELAEKLKSVDVSFIDAPVSGGIIGAENATLTFMVGGEKKLLDRATPVLNAMGTKIYHCGSIGSGQIAKASNNLILGITMAGISEAISIGVQLGLDAKVLTDIINSSSGQCWSSTIYNPVPGILPNVPSSNDYKAGFTSQMILKDLKIANKAAISAGLNVELGKKIVEIYESMCKNGLSEKDFSVVYQYINSQKK